VAEKGERIGPQVVSSDPLHDPQRDTHAVVPPLQAAIDRARNVLAEKGQANIHSKDEMIRAAYGLHYVLHDLLAALDAERGERS
jgi:hypothetical protein